MKLKGDCFRFLLSVEDISVPCFDNLKYMVRHYKCIIKHCLKLQHANVEMLLLYTCTHPVTKNYHFEYTAYLGRCKPAKSFLQSIHISIKGIQEFIAKKMILSKIKLSSGIVVALIIPYSGEVKPFWMSKFITCI